MTPFEVLRIAAEPFLPPLAWYVRHDLIDLFRSLKSPPGEPVKLLDVGARRSPYTIGLPATVTLLDVPKGALDQLDLDLGVDDLTVRRIRRRRSNVAEIRLENFLENHLGTNAYTVVVTVEVIEHVFDDRTFVREIARVLKPDGFAYITTPNGEYMPQPSPQHVRHYTRAQLAALCAEHFDEVTVNYGLGTSRLFACGHTGLDYYNAGGNNPMRRFQPLLAMQSALANVLYKLSPSARSESPANTAHLIAVCKRPRSVST